MKKINFLTLTTIFTASLLMGCGGNKPSTISINIGTKDTKAVEIVAYNDLVSKIQTDNGEDFLLATYSKVYSTGCSCWSGFQFEVMDRYVRETHTPIYYFDVDKLENEKEFGISKLYESSPEFYVFKGSKAIRKYQYIAKTNNIMKSYNHFKEEMDQVVKTPSIYSLYYVDENFLDENLAEQESQNLLIMRNGCGDCRYALPHAIIPMTQVKEFKNELWVFDIQSYKSSDSSYLNIKVKYGLNEGANALFGYGQGVVPTVQHYEKGLLKDAAVYFNDELVKDGDNYKISKTYYTEERVNNLSFLKKSTLKIKSLEGLSIPSSDVTNGYWNQDAASKVHTPILQAFLTTYCL